MFKTTTTIISAFLLLQGCAGSSIKQPKPANVTSIPSGATVYANNLELGKTPLKRNLYDDFPAGWQNSIYQAQGVLIVKKDGCKDFTLKINDAILRNPIHAELKCRKVSKTEIPAPVASSQNETEARLKKLDALLKKGLVTKEEYKKTRERILSEI